jgi:hypothetical protein
MSPAMPDTNAIFISYRRSDSNDVSGRIYDRLVAHFSKAAVFKDVHSIPYGVDFPTYIQQELAKCKLLLAVIGPTWLTVERHGQRRLNDPADWVRIEIEMALENDDITVIPVLVGNTRLPAKTEFPDGLAALASLNSAQARPDPDFHVDMNRLIRRLEEIVGSGSTVQAPQLTSTHQTSPMLEALQMQRNALKAQFDAVVEKLTYADEVDTVRYETQRDSLGRKLAKLDQQIQDLG